MSWRGLKISAFLAFALAACGAVSLQMSTNSDDTIDTEFPAGNKPEAGASCSTFTDAARGDAGGECDEVSSTAFDLSSNSTTWSDHYYTRQTQADTGDSQIKGQVPSIYGGYNEPFTAGFVGISEGTGDNDWLAQCVCPVTGGVRFYSGTPTVNNTEVGAAGPCFDKYLALTYDQSAGDLICMESTDDITYTQVGTTVSRALTCGSGCPNYVGLTSGDVAQTTFASFTNVSSSSTISVTPTPPATGENLVWTGDFSTEDFTQYHRNNNVNEVVFPAIPIYGRPPQYGNQLEPPDPDNVGNGDLMDLVAITARMVNGNSVAMGPVRGSDDFAVRVQIKNSANEDNGTDPATSDCDPQRTPFSLCDRRRSELDFALQADDYNMFPAMTERWWSYSIYLPSDYDSGASGILPITMYGIKSVTGQGSSILSLSLGDSWGMSHRWNPDSGEFTSNEWQYQMKYTGEGTNFGFPGAYPRTGSGDSYWPDGAGHYPNEAASIAALQSINVGGWTDFVVNIHPDHRGAGGGGVGFIKVWKREDLGSWTQIVNIVPGSVDRGGLTFDMGIGYNRTDGYGPKMGMYAFSSGADRVLDKAENTVLYIDNIKAGSENATFEEMAHDGSSP